MSQSSGHAPSPADRIATALRPALHRIVCDSLPEGGLDCDEIATVLAATVDAIAAERAAEELLAAADEIEREGWRPQYAAEAIRARAAALTPEPER